MTVPKNNPKQTVPVLMYHHVTPEGGSLSCSVRNFDSQLKALVKRGYHTLTAEQFARFLKGEPVPEKSVVLTFDDGYLNNFVYAHPILQKYNLHALMFLITKHIHEGGIRPVMGSSDVLPSSPGHYECQRLIASIVTLIRTYDGIYQKTLLIKIQLFVMIYFKHKNSLSCIWVRLVPIIAGLKGILMPIMYG